MRLIFATVIALVSFASSAATFPTPKPRTFDLGRGKPVFTEVLSNSKGQVDVQFVGDLQIAATALDRYVWPTRNSDPADIHFNIYFFDTATGVEAPQQALHFTVKEARPELRGLPSGGFLISLGEEVLSYNARHELIARTPTPQICGFGEDLLTDKFDTFLYIASDDVAVLNVVTKTHYDWSKPAAEKERNSHFCWFSTHDLHAISHFKTTTYSPASSARENKIHLLFSAHTQEVTPNGMASVPIPAQCPLHRPYVESRVLYLLHFRDATILPCFKQTLALKTGDNVELLKIRSSQLYPYIVADAWTAPVVLLHSGNAEVKLFGGFKISDELELFNYETSKSLNVMRSQEDLPGPIYLSGQIKYSLSPSGRHVAISRGPLVSIYDIPQQFLNSSAHQTKTEHP